MQDWSEGYMTEVAYTYGYYGELNPLRARLALLAAGYVPPDVGTACELGFGQGLSINIHDAAGAAHWTGTDFSPAQVGFARELAGGEALAGRLFDEAFEAFCRRDDLPDFDFIGLHGIWSWVSDSNRATIADFIKRKLKVGGVLYVSYNTQPGWAATGPLQELLTGYDAALGAPGTETAGRIDAALDFAGKLLDSGALYGKANPTVAKHLDKLRGQDRHYLAHEYFNRDWQPMPFARMRAWMESLKLQYGASAHFLDHIPAFNLTAAQQQLLAGIPDPGFRETARDFIVNRHFRRDYWIRGARRMTPLEQAERLRAQRVVLSVPAASVALTARGVLGEATLHEPVYRPILDALAGNRIRTLGEIERDVEQHGITAARVVEAVLILAGTGVLHPAHEHDAIVHASARSTQLNARLCRLARYGGDVTWLASPVTGGATPVGRIEQLFLLARSLGHVDSAAWAQYASLVLEAQGEQIVRDGQPVDSGEQQLEILRVQANQFDAERLPVLQALGALP
jgi:SAM-dependent methyltransferase